MFQKRQIDSCFQKNELELSVVDSSDSRVVPVLNAHWSYCWAHWFARLDRWTSTTYVCRIALSRGTTTNVSPKLMWYGWWVKEERKTR